MNLPVFEHVEGMDCPCDPEQTAIGVCHHGELGRIDQLSSSGDSLLPPLPNIGD